MSTAYLPVEGLGEPGTGKAFKRSGSITQCGRTLLTQQRWCAGSYKGDSTPATSTSAHTAPAPRQPRAPASTSGEDAPSTERGVARRHAGSTRTWGWCETTARE